MMLTLYSADYINAPSNCSYPHKFEITDAAVLADAVKRDYVCAEYMNNYRSGDNFLGSDCLPVDCDNDHSENPADWVTPADVQAAFPGITFAVHYSRFHMREKNGKPARPKFHVLFPIEYMTDASAYSEMKKLVNTIFPYFDTKALDAARFFFGTAEPQVEIFPGELTLSEYLSAEDFDADMPGGSHGGTQVIPEGSRNATMSRFAGRVIKKYGDNDTAFQCFIHKENQEVAALEQPMKDATQQVLDIREEITMVSQNASKTAEDAKTIARAAESNASQALATAKNAKDDAFNAAGDAELAMAAAQQVEQNYTTMELMLSGKVDGAFVENGYLYLTSNNVVVAGPLGPFSGTGGGSGGSGGNNAILQVSNTSGWLSKSIAYGKECPIQITWSSLEDEMPTGNGVMKVTVNGIIKAMLDIPQGMVTADLGPYLTVGSNAVRIQVSDAYENSRTINFNVSAIEA